MPHPYVYPTQLIEKLSTTVGAQILAQLTPLLKVPNNPGCAPMLARALVAMLDRDKALAQLAIADLVAFGMAPKGSEDELAFASLAQALCFDMCYEFMSTDTIVALGLQADTALFDQDPKNLLVNGYNDEGYAGIGLAVACDNPNARLLVTASRTTGVPFRNWAHVRASGCCGPEGWGYHQFAIYNFIEYALEKAVLGSNDLDDLPWFTRYAEWFYHQAEPCLNKYGGWVYGMQNNVYGGGPLAARPFYEMLACVTAWGDSNNRQLARWILDQTTGAANCGRDPFRSFLCMIMIGDPRVPGVSPAALNLSLEFAA